MCQMSIQKTLYFSDAKHIGIIMMSKIKTFLNNPRFILSLVLNKNRKWVKDSSINVREYSSYDEYVRHQAEKSNIVGEKFLSDGKVFGKHLEERIRSVGLIKQGMSVLCLGARLGFEVESFIRCGCFAVGIDLNPGKDNKHVVVGDFHNIDFADSSVDVVFTNSLDHSFDLKKVLKEIKRVLKNNGIFVVELNAGSKEGYKFKYYESVSWDNLNDMILIFSEAGFKIIGSSIIDDLNMHYVMRVEK